MPRARRIKPQFWSDEKINALTIPAAYLFIALWSLVDDDGRGDWQPKTIDGYAFPGHEVDIDALLGELTAIKLIVRYHDPDSGQRYYYIPNFVKHQQPHPHYPSHRPAPPAAAAAKTGGESREKSLAVPEVKALKPARTARIPDTPTIKVLSHHFGEPTLDTTRTIYYKFIQKTLKASGFADDDDGAAETERRIFNMKAAHHDNTRAWTITNLIAKWDHWSVDRQPVTAKQRDQYLRRQRSEAVLQHVIGGLDPDGPTVPSQ